MESWKDTLIRFPPVRAVHRRIAGARLARVFARREGAEPFEEFTCNVCGATNQAPHSFICGRETPSCTGCASTLRFRTIVHVLSMELFGESLVIADFPHCEATGIGLSDALLYARPLSRRLRYTNTFFHREPRLDICAPAPRWRSSCDFVIASEVFEHVPPPVEQSFRALFAVMRPGGLCVFSVPSRADGDTVEHYPSLYEWHAEKEHGKYVLYNRTRDGLVETFDNLRFHGGPGATLEMRIFSHDDLVAQIESSGFCDVRAWKGSEPRYGIEWNTDSSYILSFRRPR